MSETEEFITEKIYLNQNLKDSQQKHNYYI